MSLNGTQFSTFRYRRLTTWTTELCITFLRKNNHSKSQQCFVVPILTDLEFSILFVCSGTVCLTLNMLTWRIWWDPNNTSKWHMGINSAFKALILSHFIKCWTFVSRCCVEEYCYMYQLTCLAVWRTVNSTVTSSSFNTRRKKCIIFWISNQVNLHCGMQTFRRLVSRIWRHWTFIFLWMFHLNMW